MHEERVNVSAQNLLIKIGNFGKAFSSELYNTRDEIINVEQIHILT